MVLLCLIFTVMIRIQIIRLRWLLRLQGRERSGSTPTCTRVVRCVCRFWVRGEAVQAKTGILNFLPCSNSSSPPKVSPWVTTSTSMNLDLTDSRAPKKAKRKTKPTATLSDWAISSTQWSSRSGTHQKVLRTSFSVISTSRRKKFSKSATSGCNGHKSDKPRTLDWFQTTTARGALSWKSQRPSTWN